MDRSPCFILWGICQKPVIFEKPVFRDFTEIIPEFVSVDSPATHQLDDLGKVTLEPALELLFLLFRRQLTKSECIHLCVGRWGGAIHEYSSEVVLATDPLFQLLLPLQTAYELRDKQKSSLSFSLSLSPCPPDQEYTLGSAQILNPISTTM